MLNVYLIQGVFLKKTTFRVLSTPEREQNNASFGQTQENVYFANFQKLVDFAFKPFYLYWVNFKRSNITLLCLKVLVNSVLKFILV